MKPPLSEQLIETLRYAQRLGFFGPGDLAPAIAQAEDFASIVPSDAARLVDIGSGGGLPGLIVATRHPAARVAFVERRGARADVLRRAIRRLSLGVTVFHEDLLEFARRSDWAGQTDVVTARGFSDAATTWRLAAPLLRPGGCLIVSDSHSDQGNRWRDLGADVAARLGTVSMVVSRETTIPGPTTGPTQG